MSTDLPFSPASERNREPILAALRPLLGDSGLATLESTSIADRFHVVWHIPAGTPPGAYGITAKVYDEGANGASSLDSVDPSPVVTDSHAARARPGQPNSAAKAPGCSAGAKVSVSPARTGSTSTARTSRGKARRITWSGA